tara:strand:- start:348 stop:686 length:339 start_codon:yes stop_codon:yes gene_type:complete
MLVADLLRLEGEGVAFNLEDVFVIEGTLPEELRAEHHWSCPLFLGDDQPHNLSLGLSLGIFRTEPYPKGDTNADMAVCAKSLFSEVYPAEAPFAEGVLPALGAGDSRFSLRA